MLMMLMRSAAALSYRIDPSKFVERAGWKLIVNIFVDQPSNHRRTLRRAGLEFPSMKTVYLSKELVWKALNPRL